MKPQSTTHFETSLTSLDRKLRGHARQLAFQGESPAQARAWQKKARTRLASRLGMDRFQPVTPRATRISATAEDGYTREEWKLLTERDVWMPFSLLVPNGPTSPAPAVICPHGHGSGGRLSTSGRRDVPGMDEVIDRYNYDYGVQLARSGCITVCPDARGFGERREAAQQNEARDPEAHLRSSCYNLSVAGLGQGLTVQGMWTWDLMRLVDWLESEARVDKARIGCAGLSGGGLQTLNLAALDTRIAAAVVSGYFYGVRESLLQLNTNCTCNIVPGLWLDFDMGDIGALIAPRALFIETGDRDPLNGAGGLKNVRSQLSITRRVYAALQATGKVSHHVFAGEHRWCGERAVPWLAQQLAA